MFSGTLWFYFPGFIEETLSLKSVMSVSFVYEKSRLSFHHAKYEKVGQLLPLKHVNMI